MAYQSDSHQISDPVEPDILSLSTGWDLPEQPSPAKEFLESLPIVIPEDLPENSQTCHICHELFNDPDLRVEESAESAVRLTCSHIMGSECLMKWFERTNSCPMCRATLFRQAPRHNVIFSTSEEQSEVLQNLDAELLELTTLSAENSELHVRLRELQAASGPEERQEEVSRIMDRFREVDTRLEEIEGRVRGMGHWGRDTR